MKTSMAAVAAAIALACPAAGWAQAHGGRVLRTKVASYELVAKKDVVTIWVDRPGRGFTVQGTVAELTIHNASGQLLEKSRLLPGNGNALIARGPFRMPSASRLTATVTLPGQPTEKLAWKLP